MSNARSIPATRDYPSGDEAKAIHRAWSQAHLRRAPDALRRYDDAAQEKRTGQ